MKIFIGILIIVLVVFLKSVELGTPLGGGFSFRPGSAPKPVRVPVPSGSKLPGKGRRQGSTLGGRIIQPAAAPAAALSAEAAPPTAPRAAAPGTPRAAPSGTPRAAPPETPRAAPPGTPRAVPPGTPGAVLIAAQPPTPESVNHQSIEENTYIKDPQRGFIKIREAGEHKVQLLQYGNLIIGRIAGEDILPIFNKDRKIIRIDVYQNCLQIIMSKPVARRWGVFGKYADFCRAPPPIVAA